MDCVRWKDNGAHMESMGTQVLNVSWLLTQKAEEGAQTLNSDTPPPGIIDKRILDRKIHPLATSVPESKCRKDFREGRVTASGS